jgi:hypothetical protein
MGVGIGGIAISQTKPYVEFKPSIPVGFNSVYTTVADDTHVPLNMYVCHNGAEMPGNETIKLLVLLPYDNLTPVSIPELSADPIPGLSIESHQESPNFGIISWTADFANSHSDVNIFQFYLDVHVQLTDSNNNFVNYEQLVLISLMRG